jgi:hypothetical protein
MNQADDLVSRTDARKHWHRVSAMQYWRYEQEGFLTPLKAGGALSARVFYRKSELERLMQARLPKPPPDDEA